MGKEGFQKVVNVWIKPHFDIPLVMKMFIGESKIDTNNYWVRQN